LAQLLHKTSLQLAWVDSNRGLWLNVSEKAFRERDSAQSYHPKLCIVTFIGAKYTPFRKSFFVQAFESKSPEDMSLAREKPSASDLSCDMKMAGMEGGDGLESLEQLKSRVLVLLDDVERSVSTVYSSYVRPYCEIGGSGSDFLFSSEDLRSHAPNIQKVRLYLFQVMTLLDCFWHDGIGDPLPESEYHTILLLVRSISPLSVAIGGDVFMSFLVQLRTVHGELFPRTLNELETDLGISEKEPDFGEPELVEKRVHYADGSPAGPKRNGFHTGAEAAAAPRHGFFHGRNVMLGRSIKVKVKKSKAGPEPIRSQPVLQ
jgi:hypothetical protein